MPVFPSTSILSLAGQSLTGTAANSLVSLLSTWNTSGTVTALLLNVTDTASNAASLLMDLQVGGTSYFKVSKAGLATTRDIYPAATNTYNLGTTGSVWGGVFATNLTAADSGAFQWASGDVRLLRDAANTLALRNSTTAQTFRVYNTYTDASNYERVEMSWATSSNIFQIISKALGTGTNRAIDIGYSSTQLFRQSAGVATLYGQNLVWGTDNTYDIGASGATRPRAVYVAASVFASQSVAIPAGGTAGAGVMVSSTANFGVFFGSGVPTLSAAKGSIYLRSDGSSTSTRMYCNTDGSTAWTAVTTAT